MISFFCSQCGLKLQVKPEFAGRSSRCPTCKHPLVVPAPSLTQADVVAGQIDGTDSSLAKAGVEGGVTLEQSIRPRSGQKSVQELLARRAKKDGRYVIEGEIARGGMGTVLRAVDCDIRREVAVKYLLDQDDSGKQLRFIEEAQITGQLEHPNIVPIHELGVDHRKRLFFSMKMVKGRSLAQVLDQLRQDPKAAEKDYSLGRLLSTLVNVCNALAYAHSCGVVHRDLKPANIMIGDFGEVYVMDWGLAKVLKGGRVEQPAPLATVITGVPAAAPRAVAVPNQSTSSKRPSKVETSRQVDADVTQEGAVLGTPVYMPPEQATGRVEAIDQRSDVYSLGAILYEMLTLQPPVHKDGGYLAILMRVMQGEIVPPEHRSPQRARAGLIPKGLSAIAMKALAKSPHDRYATVEALRQDIERFQEGRSVSAKEDTKWEAVWRLVKRNKLATGFTGVLTVVLVWSSVVNFLARREAEQANAKTKERTEKAVPALVESARLGVERRKYQTAREQVDLALDYAPNRVDARLLKGQLLILDLKFGEAGKELERYLGQRPDDSASRRLQELCGRPHPGSLGNLLDIAHVFEQQQVPALADGLLRQHAGNSFEAKNRLLKIYQERIDAAWQGQGRKLSLEAAGIYSLNLLAQTEVTNLAPLEGMPLTNLNLSLCGGVRDLTPLRGMPLTSLQMNGCGQVQDLKPLHGMPLTTLNLANCGRVRDLAPLQGMKLTLLSLVGSVQVRDLTPLRGMPLTSLFLEGSSVTDLTPLQGMSLTEVSINARTIYEGMDLLRHMKSLKTVDLGYGRKFSAEVFWKKVDAGEFKR